MTDNNGKFKYSYTAPTEAERLEIESIRRQYSARNTETDKLQRLRYLDALIKNTARAASITLGVLATLLFGLGLSMVLVWRLFAGGVIVAMLGAVGFALAYPLNLYILKRGKNKHGDEILRLSEELLNENKS